MPKITNDAGHLETEAEIKKLEKEIRKEYQKAAKEVEDKLNKYMSSFSAKDEIKKKQVADKILTQEEYDKWRIGQLAVGKRWEEMKDSLASDLANTSEIARSTARGYMPEVYALNHNYATFQVEQSSLLDTSYTLYDRQTVERLFREKPKLMPPMSAKTAEKMRREKLKKWNEQKIQSAVMQGILQGESIPKIARRMRDVTDMDYKASIRNARTSITSAQNGGRMDAYHRAEDLGIHQKKQWLSTLDDRTRHEHVDLDGQRQELDDPFIVTGDDGTEYEIMFPGAPDANPAMVYNCRCTMITTFDGYDKQVSDFDLSQNEKLGDMTYDEWKKEHGTKQKEEEPDPKNIISLDNPNDFGKAGIYDAFRSGGLYESPLGFLSFGMDEKQSEDYISLHKGDKTKEYLIDTKNPLYVTGRSFDDIQNELAVKYTGKSIFDDDLSLDDARKIMKMACVEIEKEGYDSILQVVENKITRKKKYEIGVLNGHRDIIKLKGR